MVGDDLINDIKGAQQMGMHAVLVETGKYRKALVDEFKYSNLTAVFLRLEELPKYLQTQNRDDLRHNTPQEVIYYFCAKCAMKNLIVIGHPDQQSFCYNGIFRPSNQKLRQVDKSWKSSICIAIALRVHELL